MGTTPAGRAGRTGQDERAQRLPERSRQCVHPETSPMGIGNVLMMVIDNTYQRQGVRALPVIVGILGKAEHPCRAHMIARHRKVHQEVAGKEVPSVSTGLQVGEDEDVREGRGRISHVGPLLEGVEQVPYAPVDHGGILVIPGTNRPGVHRGVVGLIVDDQERRAGYRGVRSRRSHRTSPAGQIAQNGPVLLHDHDHRITTQPEVELVGHPEAEIAVLPCIGRGYRMVQGFAEQGAHTDASVSAAQLQVQPGVPSQKALIEAQLRLRPEAVGGPGQNHHELVPGIHRLADQIYVVGGLPRLHLAHHHSAAIPRSRPGRVLHQREDAIREIVRTPQRRQRPPLLLLQEPPVAPGEPPLYGCASLRQPGNMVAPLIGQG